MKIIRILVLILFYSVYLNGLCFSTKINNEEKAKVIFDKLLRVINNYNYKLKIVDTKGGNWAYVMKKEPETVFLTKSGLNFCYKDKRFGDTRIAFVLAHELAHLVKEHLTEKDPEAMIKNYFLPKKNEFQSDIKTLKLNILKEHEEEADKWALVYMAIIDYYPVIKSKKGWEKFFKEWAIYEAHAAAKQFNSKDVKEILKPKERSNAIIGNINRIKSIVDYFNAGVMLYKMGKYDYAEDAFKKFDKEFPNSTIKNNLGIISINQAFNIIKKNDENIANKYKFSTILETDLTEKIFSDKRIVRRNGIHEFRINLNNAKKLFEDALKIRKSVTYYTNLSSVYILGNIFDRKHWPKISDAIYYIQKGEQIDPDNIDLLNNKAIALYLESESNKMKSIDILNTIIQERKNYPNAFYNKGRILEQSNDNSYINCFTEYNKLTSNNDIKGLYNINFIDYPPSLLGKDYYNIKNTFLHNKEIKIGDLLGYYSYTSGKKTCALSLRDKFMKVLCIEALPDKTIKFSKITNYPKNVFLNINGHFTYIYKDRAIDVEDGIITKVMYF